MRIGSEGRRLFKHEFDALMKENDCKSIEDVKNLLFDSSYDDSPYVIHNRWYDIPDRTMIQRFNLFWVYPMYVVLIPFRYVIYGDASVNKHSKLGDILVKLLGSYD